MNTLCEMSLVADAHGLAGGDGGTAGHPLDRRFAKYVAYGIVDCLVVGIIDWHCSLCIRCCT